MESFIVCSSCSRHVKARETACPFCRAVQPPRVRARRPTIARMSRGTWLALGSTISLIACSGAIDPQSVRDPDGGGSERSRDGGDSARDGGAGTIDGAVPAGSFACGSSACNRATEYCALSSSSGSPEGCDEDDGEPFPSQCTSDPTCDCVSAHILGSCHCIELDDGAGIGIECAGCYGSPPARLDTKGTPRQLQKARHHVARRRYGAVSKALG